jgi:hypothetical protein
MWEGLQVWAVKGGGESGWVGGWMDGWMDGWGEGGRERGREGGEKTLSGEFQLKGSRGRRMLQRGKSRRPPRGMRPLVSRSVPRPPPRGTRSSQPASRRQMSRAAAAKRKDATPFESIKSNGNPVRFSHRAPSFINAYFLEFSQLDLTWPLDRHFHSGHLPLRINKGQRRSVVGWHLV